MTNKTEKIKANGRKGSVGIGDTSVNIIISTQKEPLLVYDRYLVPVILQDIRCS